MTTPGSDASGLPAAANEGPDGERRATEGAAAGGADVASRASAATYRALLESLDTALCVFEMIYDDAGAAVDYRFLEANPAFEAHSGLTSPVGRTIRELVPGIETHWIERYARVAGTGEAIRFQQSSEILARWFDVFAFRLGEPEQRRVALHFTDITAAKHAEQERERLARALELERARLEYVFRHAPAFVSVVRGPDHVMELVNDAYYEMVGRRDVIGKPLLEALPELEGQGFVELLDRVVATGEPFVGKEIPAMLVRTPGAPPEQRFVDFTYLPIVEADGSRSGVLAHGLDVTEQVLARREVEHLLAESERARADAMTFRTLLEFASDGHALLDETGRFLWANPVMTERLGYSLDEFRRLTAWDIDALHHTPESYHAGFARTQGDRAGLFDTLHRRRDGSIVPVEVTTAVVHLAEGPRLFATARDVTERKQAEAALTAERERLRALILHMPAPVALLVGPEHRLELVNDAFRRVSAGGKDVTGLTPREAFPELEGQGFFELFDRVYETGEPWVGHETLVRYDRDGTGVIDTWFDLRYEPVRDAEGRVFAILNFAVDVTGQVRARQEVEYLLATAERASREAAEANQAKSAFLATMSHELRTPLNAIQGYAQLIDLGIAGPLTQEQRDYLARLARSSDHLLGLVNDVLDFSKIEAGETRVLHEDARTGPAVQAALDLVRPQAEAKGVRLVDARPDDGGIPYVGDDARVRQIILNLLSNAAKFTPAGGTVTVSCGRRAETPHEVGHLRGEGPWAFVRVADTGVGIAPEEQRRIFEPFHQVDGGRTRGQGGTGLGLAISRRLAHLMGGDLTVESTPGVGSVFTLWLPAARSVDDAQTETAAERSARADMDLAHLEAPGLAELGEVLRSVIDEVLASYADRLGADPAIPGGRTMRRTQLEDHAVTILADLSQSLVILGEAGAEAAELLEDGSAIQCAIAEAHGVRRHAQGFDEGAVRRDHRIFREEVERAVRGRLQPGGEMQDAMAILLRLIDRAEAMSVRGWRRAAEDRGRPS